MRFLGRPWSLTSLIVEVTARKASFFEVGLLRKPKVEIADAARVLSGRSGWCWTSMGASNDAQATRWTQHGEDRVTAVMRLHHSSVVGNFGIRLHSVGDVGAYESHSTALWEHAALLNAPDVGRMSV